MIGYPIDRLSVRYAYTDTSTETLTETLTETFTDTGNGKGDTQGEGGFGVRSLFLCPSPARQQLRSLMFKITRHCNNSGNRRYRNHIETVSNAYRMALPSRPDLTRSTTGRHDSVHG
jgi:hypothetical protein